MKRPHFRFEDLEIWRLAKGFAVCFLKVADNLGKTGGEGEERIKKLIIMQNRLIQSLFGIEIVYP